MTSATPQPRAGESTKGPEWESETERRVSACVNACEGISTDWLEWSTSANREPVLNVLQSERDLLRTRETELVEVLTRISNMSSWEGELMLFIAHSSLAKRP
jgi:hypothetical protein